MKWFSRRKDKEKAKEKEAEKAAKVDSGKEIESKKSMKELYAGGPSSAPADAKAMAGKKATEGKKTVEGKKKVKKYGNAYRVLVKPLVTEKATNLGGQNKYVFAVSSKANKIEIAKAINEVYGVKPVAVNIIKMQGKKTRYGKVTGRTKDWKKAVITLQEGETIKVYEGV